MKKKSKSKHDKQELLNYITQVKEQDIIIVPLLMLLFSVSHDEKQAKSENFIA